MREKTVCFSGHRPEKLPDPNSEDAQLLMMVKSLLYYQIRRSAEEGYTRFITGLARGVDLWAAGYVLELKRDFSGLQLICVKPTENHGKNFRGEDRYLFDSVLARADEMYCTGSHYTRRCYQIRNRYMVDHAQRLIAVVDDYNSGTGQTIGYARKCGLELCVIDIGKLRDKAEAEPDEPIIAPLQANFKI